MLIPSEGEVLAMGNADARIKMSSGRRFLRLATTESSEFSSSGNSFYVSDGKWKNDGGQLYVRDPAKPLLKIAPARRAEKNGPILRNVSTRRPALKMATHPRVGIVPKIFRSAR